MFGIVICRDCGRKRIIDLSDGITKCPHCGCKAETKKLNVLFKGEDQNIVRSVFSTMTGYVPEEQAIPTDGDPMSALAFEVSHISDIGLKLSTICDGLSEIKGTFTLEDVEKVAPGKGEKYVKVMLEECMIYEVSLGKYKK